MIKEGYIPNIIVNNTNINNNINSLLFTSYILSSKNTSIRTSKRYSIKHIYSVSCREDYRRTANIPNTGNLSIIL